MTNWTEKIVYDLRDDINCPYENNDMPDKTVVDVGRLCDGWEIKIYKRKNVKIFTVGNEEWIICVGGRGLVESCFSKLTTRETGMILKAISVAN